MAVQPLNDQEKVDLREIYDEFDRNSDGFIDHEELTFIMEKLGMNTERPSVENVFKLIDTDGNGLIDYPEFAKWWVVAVSEA